MQIFSPHIRKENCWGEGKWTENWCSSTISALRVGRCDIINEIHPFSLGDVVLNLEIEFEQFSTEHLTFLLTE